jgi:DNA polymerase V
MASGGKRIGAGRPKGLGKYGETTVALRVPASLAEDIKKFTATKGFQIPLYSSSVQAGALTDADSHIESFVDLNKYLVHDSSNTFMVRVAGESMIDAGIFEGDLLIVDKTIPAKPGKIVIAAVDDQLTVKYLKMDKGKLVLMPANPKFDPIPIDKEKGVRILGVVTSCTKKF